MQKTITFLLILLAPLLVFSTGACGGGGTTAANPQLALFSGTYCFVAFSGTNGTPDEANATWGEVTADGAGTLTGGTFMENENGVISPGAQPPTPYTIDASRAFTLLSGGLPIFTGRITADGKAACLAAVGSGESPAIVILGRKEGTYSNASLNGLYHLAGLSYLPTGPTDSSFWGTAMFDGLGMHTSALSENTDGTNVGPFMSTRAYSVAADGAMTANFGGIEMAGALLAGGELLILAGDTTAAGPPAILVLTRATAGASDALLNGTYALAGIHAEIAPTPEWVSNLFVGTANGAGTYTPTSGTSNEDGLIVPLGALGPEPYAVAANGAFTLAGFYLGGVTPSGDFAACAGGTMNGTNPELFFLLR